MAVRQFAKSARPNCDGYRKDEAGEGQEDFNSVIKGDRPEIYSGRGRINVNLFSFYLYGSPTIG